MNKPRKVSPFILAMRYMGTQESARLLNNWLNGYQFNEPNQATLGSLPYKHQVPSTQQIITANPGDWVLEETPGQYRVLTNKEFHQDYEELEHNESTTWVSDNQLITLGANSLTELAESIHSAPDRTDLVTLLTPAEPNPSFHQILQALTQSQTRTYYLPDIFLHEPWKKRNLTPCPLTSPPKTGHVKITFTTPPATGKGTAINAHANTHP